LKLKIDLHVHSRYSGDSVNSFEDISRRCREQGLDGYAVCDHDRIEGLSEALEKSGDQVVVPGLEVSSRGAHILCLDPSEVVPSRLSIIETVERIHAQGATAVLAHPYSIPRSFVKFGEVKLAGLDAIEVANSAQIPFRLIMGWNRGLSERLSLPQTGGSDSHFPSTVGRSYTIIDSESRDPVDLIKAIREGRTEVVGAGTRLVERLRQLSG
jgi:predicted metal-dependent phosphoesterase TrpH